MVRIINRFVRFIEMKSPLSGVKLIELGGRDSVAFCGYCLALLGAEVLKIEAPVG